MATSRARSRRQKPTIDKELARRFVELALTPGTTIRELMEAAGPHEVVIDIKARHPPRAKKKKAHAPMPG